MKTDYYTVIGRISFSDEDSAFTYEAEKPFKAVQQFKLDIVEEAKLNDADFEMTKEDTIIISFVILSDSPMDIIPYD